jgi:hypothetical protein
MWVLCDVGLVFLFVFLLLLLGFWRLLWGGWLGGVLGCWGMGQQPLCPCFLDVEEYAIRFSASGVTVLSGFFADSVFSTENIAPGSLTSDDP